MTNRKNPATFYPDVEKTRVVFHSNAEKKFYDACHQQLDEKWDVYYSVTLSASDHENGMQENEIDFLLYHPHYGVVAVEVKGGRIQYDADRQQFISVDRHHRKHFIKNPFQQARVWKSRFIKEMKNQGIEGPVSHFVCFPDVASSDFPRLSQVDPHMILDQLHLDDIAGRLKTMIKQMHPAKYLDFRDIREPLHGFLQGENYTSKIYLKDYIHSQGSRLRDVESIHDTFMIPISSAKRLGIEGEAGTGKTLLAKSLAEKFIKEQKQVLFLSSNGLLNSYLQRELGKECNVETFEGLGKKYGLDLLHKPDNSSSHENDWIQFEAPEKLRIAVESSLTRYDVIICDEAQDVQPFWWDGIQALLLPTDESRLYVFFDRNQGIFGSGGDEKKFVPEDVLPMPGPYFPLVNNYRTTREIADLARHFRSSKTALDSHTARLGYLPKIITYKNREHARELLSKLCENLVIEEGIKSKDIALLSARKFDAPESMIGSLTNFAKGFQFVDLNAHTDIAQLTSKQIPASTIQSFKGLETDIGIICNISEYNLPLDHPIMASLLYVACTRAKHMLYIFVQEEDEKRKILQEALKKVRYDGALVVDDIHTVSELIGTVEYYDAKRFGIITFESSHHSRSKAMFFPNDLDSDQLELIKTGDKLSFVAKIIGETLIASKIQVMALEEEKAPASGSVALPAEGSEKEAS